MSAWLGLRGEIGCGAIWVDTHHEWGGTKPTTNPSTVQPPRKLGKNLGHFSFIQKMNKPINF
jgi:hypothetical protein